MENKSELVNFTGMRVSFTKKEERNKLQELDFLKLSPEERFYTFLQLSERLQKFPVSKKRLENGNFLINIKRV